MKSFPYIFILLALLAFAEIVPAQNNSEPVSRRVVSRWLTLTQDDPERSREANESLIEEIEVRGVDFVLMPEEEWALTLLEASDKLIEAIRKGMPAEKREAILRKTTQTKLYASFLNNYRLRNANSQRTAINSGKEFLRLYKNDATVKTQTTLISRNLPQLERTIQMLERKPRVVRKVN